MNRHCVQDALWRMDDSKLSVEQLTALSRAVPEDQERRDLGLFLRVCLARQNLSPGAISLYTLAEAVDCLSDILT